MVARHVDGDYKVAMIGFTPGWSYLSGLPASMQLSRRQNPRLLTPAGTISIGGIQTGVQCLAGPSGWHLLGRTAVRTYQLGRDPTFLLEPGDAITFAAVDQKTFNEQDRAAERRLEDPVAPLGAQPDRQQPQEAGLCRQFSAADAAGGGRRGGRGGHDP